MHHKTQNCNVNQPFYLIAWLIVIVLQFYALNNKALKLLHIVPYTVFRRVQRKVKLLCHSK